MACLHILHRSKFARVDKHGECNTQIRETMAPVYDLCATREYLHRSFGPLVPPVELLFAIYEAFDEATQILSLVSCSKWKAKICVAADFKRIVQPEQPYQYFWFVVATTHQAFSLFQRMHRVLQIPEILLNIFCRCSGFSVDDHKSVDRDLAALARTCRSFKDRRPVSC